MVWPATNRRLAPSIQVTELIPVYLAARRGIACSQLSERKGKTTSLDQKGFNRNANRIILYTRNPCIQRAFPLPFHMDNDSYLISISVEFHWQTCRREAYKTPESSTIIRLERRSWKGDRSFSITLLFSEFNWPRKVSDFEDCLTDYADYIIF